MERWHSSVTMMSKRLDRDVGVVFNRFRLLEQPAQLITRFLFQVFGQLLAFQHGVQALDGADANARGGIERVAGQALNDVLLGEFEVVVGRLVLLEFLQGLVTQIAAVDQEQHAARAGELDQAVDERDGGEGLAGAGGHLDQGARAVFTQGLLQVPDRSDLWRPKALLNQCGHLLHAGQKGAAGHFVFAFTVGHLGGRG